MKKKQNKSSLKYAIYFIVLLLFFGLISLTFKLGAVIKNSSFDGSHSYNLHFQEEVSNCVIAFSPDSKKIFIAEIEGEIGDSIQNNLNIPVDGRINRSCLGKDDLFFGIFSLLPNSLGTDSKPTFIDLFKLAFFAKNVPSESVTKKQIKITEDEQEKQKILSSLFLDRSIVEERKSVEIINSTDIPGLGARLSLLLNNIGANIVLITSDKSQKKSQILYYGEESYTLSRITSILDFEKVKKEGEDIADIVIIIGEDQVNTIKF